MMMIIYILEYILTVFIFFKSWMILHTLFSQYVGNERFPIFSAYSFGPTFIAGTVFPYIDVIYFFQTPIVGQ